MSGVYPEPQLGAFSATAAVIAYLVCAHALEKLRPEARRFDLPEFELPLIDHWNSMSASDRGGRVRRQRAGADRGRRVARRRAGADRCGSVCAAKSEGAGELALQDILAELGPNSRVVRLFDPAAMPTPGQLNARIERHLERRDFPATAPDASQALYDALTELRRSLR